MLSFTASLPKSSLLKVLILSRTRLRHFVLEHRHSDVIGTDQNVKEHNSSSSEAEAEPWFTVDQLPFMARKELQSLCKKFGIKANAKTTTLIRELQQFHSKHLSHPKSVLLCPFAISHASSACMQSVAKTKYANVAVTFPSHSNRTSPVLTSVESVDVWASTGSQNICRTHGARGARTAVEAFPSTSSGDVMSTLPDHGVFLPSKASVTAVLNGTSREKLYMISRWRKQQIEQYGEEEFKQYTSEVTQRGKMFHSYIASVLSGEKVLRLPQSISGFCQSVSHVLADITDVTAVEKRLLHVDLGYTGFLDTTASYRGTPCVIEWKTSVKVKSSLVDCYEYPIQTAAYAGAVNCEPEIQGCTALCGLIIVAYADGRPANVHFMNLETCKMYWRQWLLRLLQYKHSFQEKPV